jgi:hypothetical protein
VGKWGSSVQGLRTGLLAPETPARFFFGILRKYLRLMNPYWPSIVCPRTSYHLHFSNNFFFSTQSTVAVYYVRLSVSDAVQLSVVQNKITERAAYDQAERDFRSSWIGDLPTALPEAILNIYQIISLWQLSPVAKQHEPFIQVGLNSVYTKGEATFTPAHPRSSTCFQFDFEPTGSFIDHDHFRSKDANSSY